MQRFHLQLNVIIFKRTGELGLRLDVLQMLAELIEDYNLKKNLKFIITIFHPSRINATLIISS